MSLTIVRKSDLSLHIGQEAVGFSERLRTALDNRTPAWLAGASDVGDASIRKYLKGAQPTIIPAVKMASALGVRLSWLLAGEGEMTGPTAPKAPGANLFDASEADWVFLPFYRFESAMQVFTPIVTETFPVRRDWVKRALGVEKGLWVTTMPTDELSSVAAAGESVVCRNTMFMELGRAYLMGIDGNLAARRYALDGFVTDDPLAPRLDPREAQLQGVFPVGEILARFGLSPVPLQP